MYLYNLKSNLNLPEEPINKKGWAEIIYENIIWLTDKLTGKPFPGKNTPHLRGSFFSGKLSCLKQEDGILAILLDAKPLIEKNPNKMCSFWLGNNKVLLITKPNHVHYFKIKSQELMDSKIASFDSLNNNQSILTQNDESWKKKRNAYSHYLSSSKISIPLENIIKRYLSYVESKKHSSIDIKQLFDDFALKANVELLIGMSVTSPNSDSTLKTYKDKLTSQMLMAESLFGIQEPDKKSIDSLWESFKEIANNFYTFYQDNLIDAIGKINMSQKERKEFELKDIMPDFNLLLLAGTETISFALQTTFYLLFTHPKVKEKLCLEIKEKLKTSEVNLDEISKLNYLDKVLKEVFRLYPPAPFILPRKIKRDINLDGINLKPGDIIFLSPYLTHRLPDIWKNPEFFDPERFSERNNIEKGAYIPFGLGDRTCPGKHYAELLIKSIIVNIYSKYQVNFTQEPSILSIEKSSAFFYKKIPVVRFNDLTEEQQTSFPKKNCK